MMNKIILWIIAFMFSIPIAISQTGLFIEANSNQLLVTGIVIIFTVGIIKFVSERRFTK